jgi:hypothetical protein
MSLKQDQKIIIATFDELTDEYREILIWLIKQFGE